MSFLMKFSSFLLIVIIDFESVMSEERYPDKFDHIDVESILNNGEERNRWIECFLDEKPCHEDAAEFFKGIE